MFRIKLKYLIFNLSIVHKTFKHGKNLKMGRFCIIEPSVVVGNDVVVRDYVKIVEGTVINDNTYIGSYVRTGKNCSIGTNVVLKPQAIISGDVIVEDNVTVGPGAVLLHETTGRRHLPTRALKGSYIGAGAMIGPGCVVGKDVIIGGQAYVTKDCMEKGVYVGVPAKKIS